MSLNRLSFFDQWTGPILLLVLGLMMHGCVAQQADVVRIKRELDAKIHQLDKSKKSLQTAVSEANNSLEHANVLIAQQREEIKEILHARAELMDQVSTLKDTDLSQLRGEIEQNQRQVAQFTQQLTQLDTEIQAVRNQLQESHVKLDPIILTLQSRLETEEKMLTEQGGKLGEFRTSLLDYQQVLTALREAAKKKEDHITQLEKSVDGVTQEQDTQSQHLEALSSEVQRTIQSLLGKVEQVHTTLAHRLDEHEQKLSRVSFRKKASLSLKSSSVSTNELEPSTKKESVLSASANLQPAQSRSHVEIPKNNQASPKTIERRVLAHSSSTSLERSATSSSRSGRVNGKDPRSFYQQAFNFLRQRNFGDAATAFSEFLRGFPQSSLAANAQYWLGECYYGQRQFQVAIDEFERVFAFYPSSNKVPASLLKIGYSHLELQEQAMARAVFQQLVRTYPQSPEAIKAHGRLQDVNATLRNPS